MEEKKYIKISFSSFFLILAIIAIVILGYFTYNFYTERNNAIDQISSLNLKLNDSTFSQNATGNTANLDANINTTNSASSQSNTANTTNTTSTQSEEKNQTTTSSNQTSTQKSYIENFSSSVSKILKSSNDIMIPLYEYNGNIAIDSNNDAYLTITSNAEHWANTYTKIASNVVNAWFCPEGQDTGNEFIVFLKKDGSVTYLRFSNLNSETPFDGKEKTINSLKDISNVITISGGDNEGIGGVGVIFVKADGTCMPYSSIEDLIKK